MTIAIFCLKQAGNGSSRRSAQGSNGVKCYDYAEEHYIANF